MVDVKAHAGGIQLSRQGQQIFLHPLWLRERVIGDQHFDPINHQRLYEPAELPSDLKVVDARADNDNETTRLKLTFSTQEEATLSLPALLSEIGWAEDQEAPPTPKSWTTALKDRTEVDWAALDDPDALKSMLGGFLRDGFCIMQNTPTHRDALFELAGRFGYIRDTNFGKIFNVELKPKATDIAYTDRALPSHTDNPYRKPIPGIQFLHCLSNEVQGGLSTLVDGIAVTERLAEEAPEQAKLLETLNIRFRYEGPTAILEHWGPMIERDHRGTVFRVRLSSRVDYVPAVDKDTLDLFYAARKRLYELSNDPEFQISFPFVPGTLLMMDNYRLLHGRTAFDGKLGRRHLQGCYTDHDGATSLYRLLANGSKVTSVLSEE